MSVRSKNTSTPGLANRPTVQEKPATPAPAKNTVAEKPATQSQPGRLQSSFERSGEYNRTFNRTYTADRPMYTPKLGTSGFGGALAGLLGKLPKVGIDGSFEKSVAAWKKEGSFGGPGSIAQGSYRVSALEAAVRGNGSVSFEGGVLTAKGELQAQATLIDAAANFQAKLGPLYAEGQGHLYAGAKANAQGELTIDPAKGIYRAQAGVDAFAGARAGVSGSVSLGKYGGASGSAEAWAGVGFKAQASASLENGRLKARFEIGAALGLGFKLGFGIDINFKGIADGIKNLFKKPFDAIKNVGKKVTDFFKGGVDKLKDAGKAVAEGIKNVGNAIGDGVKKAANKVKNFFKSLF
jgi:hypothetical protein